MEKPVEEIKKKILQFLQKINDNFLIILTHKNADPDAIASAIALKKFIEFLGYSQTIEILADEGISRISRNILEKLEVKEKIIQKPSFEPRKYGLLLVDVASPSQLGENYRLFEKSNQTLLIDHHKYNRLSSQVSSTIIIKDAPSLSEIITLILGPENIDRKLACLLLAGIITDTGRFARASSTTFLASHILANKCEYSYVTKLISIEEPFSARIARLKGMQRMIVSSIGEKEIIIGTHLGSYESEVANTLVQLGGDIVIVVSPKDNETRIVLRCSNRIKEEICENLMRYASEKLDVYSSGGHPRAGILVLKQKIDKRNAPSLTKKLVNMIKETIETK